MNVFVFERHHKRCSKCSRLALFEDTVLLFIKAMYHLILMGLLATSARLIVKVDVAQLCLQTKSNLRCMREEGKKILESDKECKKTLFNNEYFKIKNNMYRF